MKQMENVKTRNERKKKYFVKDKVPLFKKGLLYCFCSFIFFERILSNGSQQFLKHNGGFFDEKKLSSSENDRINVILNYPNSMYQPYSVNFFLS